MHRRQTNIQFKVSVIFHPTTLLFPNIIENLHQFFAGLGRTGVLIACYLVFSLRVTANDAIRYVRLKRPGSVQTRGQIICVRLFAQFILPQTVVYYVK